MLFLLIGLFFAAAVGALLRQQQNKHKAAEAAANAENNNNENNANNNLPSVPILHEEVPPPDSALSVKPISSPDAVGSATYSAAAPVSAGKDSPYSYGAVNEAKQKTRAAANLLRWCGRSSSIKIEGIDFIVENPVTYWSNGKSTVPEPCCIDITLPVELPQEGAQLPADGAPSYREMTPLQRGIYLTWLAGGRIQPPLHLCYPSIWLYGLERRAIADRLDLGICIAEAFRMLPLARWEPVLKNFINFITWLAVKIWLPEDELLNFCKKIQTVPDELLGMLLGSYANSKLPLPSAVAFTLMRTSAKLRKAALGDNAFEMPHSDEVMNEFMPLYKSACSGGMILSKPEKIITLTYKPTNQSLIKPVEDEREAKNKKKNDDAVITLPNFFDNLAMFDPLIKVWRDFAPKYSQANQPKPEPETAAEALDERPDFEKFLMSLIPDGNENAPLISTIAAVGDLLNIAHPDINVNNENNQAANPDELKIRGRDRKTILDAAQLEGWQILPNLSLSGREYYWNDKILFLPIEFGAVLSHDYFAAAYLLEFMCSLCCETGHTPDVRMFDAMRNNFNNYFNLTDDDNARLNAQIVINIPAPYKPEYYGSPVQIWLQDDAARNELRDFMIELFKSVPSLAGIADEITPDLCLALDVQPLTSPLEIKEPKSHGAEILNLLEPLFKNS